jgi:DNA helicase II / ATP-dependent DNA helicase PcrA
VLEVLPITPELLSELSAELGGCDFTDASHSDFLANTGHCDVQAAPGNGKTTLLVAKLALLSRTWTSHHKGICVISHTNAARTEVEYLISKHPTAARLMAYPHFIGTVTAFVHQYLALPYLRGLGWSVRQIDDDAFAAEALRCYPSFRALRDQAKLASMTVEKWVTDLDLHPDFEDEIAQSESLKVRKRKGQHGAHTLCGKALAKLKAEMVRRGLYRYADMTALAQRALRATPALADRLRARFPLVILDEAQDANGEQLNLLEHLFKRDDAAFQRLGDSNQTLYEDEAVAPTYWTPGSGCIPLDVSHRFGCEIADFASGLTVRKPQTIVGASTRPALRVMFLFDEATIGSVIGAFADEARGFWDEICGERDVWVVASRHNIPGKKKGTWEPKSLVDYHPAYRSEGGSQIRTHLFCGLAQKAAVLYAAGRPPAEVAELLAAAITGFARVYGWKSPTGKPVTSHNVWMTLAQRDLGLPRKVRRLLYDHMLRGDAPWNEDVWAAFMNELRPLFDPVPGDLAAAIDAYCEFVQGRQIDPTDPERRSTKQLHRRGVTLRLGSIHSIKGKSVDGILVVESEVWKDRANDQRCIDLTTVLPRAFGVTDEAFNGIGLTAATNIFVAVTRPRQLLGLAVRKSEAAALIGAVEAQGWKLVDLVARAQEEIADG